MANIYAYLFAKINVDPGQHEIRGYAIGGRDILGVALVWCFYLIGKYHLPNKIPSHPL